MTSDRTFGVEIECFAPDKKLSRMDVVRALRNSGLDSKVAYYEDRHSHKYNKQTTWTVKDDGSIEPFFYSQEDFEIVSPILKGKDGIKSLKKAIDVINRLRCEVNESCGLHVHIGTKGMNAKQMFNVFNRYCEYEDFFDQRFSDERIDNVYCESIASGRSNIVNLVNNPGYFEEYYRQLCDYKSPLTSKKRLSNISSTLVDGGRFSKVNLTAYNKHRTIEFRHADGTVSKEKIVSWVKFLLSFVEQSVQMTPKRAGDLHTSDRGVRTGIPAKIYNDFVRAH